MQLNQTPRRLPVFRMVAGKGRYTHDFDAECENPEWTDLDWGIDAPAGAIARFYARSTADPDDLLEAPYAVLADAPLERGPTEISSKLTAAGLPSQRHLRLSTALWVSETNQSPVLRWMRVAWRCP